MSGLNELDNGTYFGLEIEICINQAFYDDNLGHRNYESFYQENGADWRLDSIDNKENPFDRIILSQDVSCKCPSDMTSAEIISPKTNKRNFSRYRAFLLERVFSNMEMLFQGGTCGIHVHWSNTDIIPKSYMNNDRFKFLVAYNLYRMAYIVDRRLRHPDISGRIHHYSREPVLIIANDSMDIDLIAPLSERQLYKTEDGIVTLETAETALGPDFHYHGVRFSKIIEGILSHLDREQLAIELDDFFGVPGCLNMLSTMENRVKLNWQQVLERHTPQGPLAAKFLQVYTSLDNFINRVKGAHREIQFNPIDIDDIERYYNSMDNDLLPPFQDVFDTINLDIVNGLVKYNKKALMNIIDIDDMHFEFRLFSLDTLFKSNGGQPDPVAIVELLEKQIRLTERFCKRVVLNVVRAFKNTGGIAERLAKDEQYMEYFLYGKYYHKNNVKGAFTRLLGKSGV